MVQPCPECRQTRRHTLSCDVPNRARRAQRDSRHVYDPLAIGFDTADTGTTYTGGACDNTTTGGNHTTGGGDTTCTSGGGE